MDSATHQGSGRDTMSHNADDNGLQMKTMGLKVNYTFDIGSQERCLARWPTLINVQTFATEDGSKIGVVDLQICLRTIEQHSPELINDGEKDYAIYAYDYSEPDVPLVGQGMLSWGFGHEPHPNFRNPLVTGRITQNLLAIVNNGIKETLEVKFKLTPIAKTAQTNLPQTRPFNPQPVSILRPSPTPSETSDWHSSSRFIPNIHQPSAVPIGIAPMATGQSHHGQPNYEAQSSSQGPPPTSERRIAAIEPNTRESTSSSTGTFDGPAIAPAPTKGGRTQSRPGSRASSKPPSGRPRGRPRKKPAQAEGSTSGIEDATDADDGPSRNKKRAMTTQVERNNNATFSGVPDSLRVAASTAGSIRNMRPVAITGDVRAGGHVQEVPRAPTPVPMIRVQSYPQARPVASSGLRRESIASTRMDSFTSAYSQEARSPADSTGVSPGQIYSDEASPADIGSSPPGPRSALYSTRSSPAPSSPILPPMPSAGVPIDSGFFSGGLDSRLDDDAANKTAVDAAQKVPAIAKPKPRRSRAKKAPASGQSDLIIHTETPGPPELLPQTSLYNPPHMIKKNSEAAKTAVVTKPEQQAERTDSEVMEKKSVEKATEDEMAQVEMMSFETTTPMDLDDQNQSQPDSFDDNGQHVELPVSTISDNGMLLTAKHNSAMTNAMVPPMLAMPSRATPVEPELPMVPASDPVQPRSMLTMPLSEPAHPQTDTIGPADIKSNKNVVKRQTIKQKLEEAISKGLAPSYCNNCGAIQTPTWRKIWKQVQAGVPAYHEYSEKPGCVTAINVLSRDASGQPTSYEIIKKSLGPNDKKNAWTEVLLCNPCGIWFSKFKKHRPSDKWEKDEQRLSQTRKKRPNGSGQPRSKRARTKSDAQSALTSEAGLPTDPLGPLDGPTHLEDMIAAPALQRQQEQEQEDTVDGVARQGSTHSRASSHSRGSGTLNSPIAVDDDLGATRRVLFPSPRKEGEQRVLGEVAVNVVQTSPEYLGTKSAGTLGKENDDLAADGDIFTDNDFTDIFGTPPRPSTPPPAANSSSLFKTPTRTTPGHRPVTRSVTRSMRSSRSVNSPSRILLMETPTRTSHPGSAKRHSPDEFDPSRIFENPLYTMPLSQFGDFLSPEFTRPRPDSPLRPDMSNFDEIMLQEPMNWDRLFGAPRGMSIAPPEPSRPKKMFPHYSDEENRRIETYYAQMEAGTVFIPRVENGRPVEEKGKQMK
ncbi:hypothetical protein F4806DRAFT_377383 [Annulohypoxylon nitens]|nr:hypothetical protein F4806DRAFT_377383 [Annulohypoxylon nitens]